MFAHKSFFFFFRRRQSDNASKYDMWGCCDLPRKHFCLFMNISGFRILAKKNHSRNLQSMARRANGNLTRKLEKAARVQVIDYRRQPLVMLSIISPRIRSKLKSTGSERGNLDFFIFASRTWLVAIARSDVNHSYSLRHCRHINCSNFCCFTSHWFVTFFSFLPLLELNIFVVLSLMSNGCAAARTSR